MPSASDWPGAYILGAPKCGTTAMAQYLSEHPQIAFAATKEPHFLAADLPGLWTVPDEATYLRLFRGEGGLRMEASVWYLFSRTAVPGILARRPDARFIVMLRNPVEMIPSLHRQLCNSLEEDVADLAAAWALSAVRARGAQLPPGCRAPATLDYTRTAAFGDQLARLFALVPRERVLVLFQEEMAADTGAVYRRILAFLGLGDDGRRDFAVVNPAAGYRSPVLQRLIKRDTAALGRLGAPLKRALGVESLGFRRALDRLNWRPAERARPPEAAAEAIAAGYRDDIARLAALLERDLAADFGWPGPQGPELRSAG